MTLANNKSGWWYAAALLCICLPAIVFASEARSAAGKQLVLRKVQRPAGTPLVLMGQPVQQGRFDRRNWSAGEPMEGLSAPAPLLIASGSADGPVVCMAAAVHGDELNGVEIIRQVMFGLNPTRMRGTVVGVPIVNLNGFRRGSRYLPDRRDLNRYFPGNPTGSSASRIAYSFFKEVVVHCDVLIDIHTGSFHRTNVTQLRADMGSTEVVKLARMFGDIVVLQSQGASGTLRRAAVEAGVPSVTIEVGEPLRLQPELVEQGVRGVRQVLADMGITKKRPTERLRQRVYLRSSWLRANQGGILLGRVPLGSEVRAGDVLGTVTDPITNSRSTIVAPEAGRILGMALNQMVMPGFAAFHLGIASRDSEMATDSTAEAAAQEAIEPVKEAATAAAKQAAEAVARSTNDPEAVTAAAREAAREAVQEKVEQDKVEQSRIKQGQSKKSGSRQDRVKGDDTAAAPAEPGVQAAPVEGQNAPSPATAEQPLQSPQMTPHSSTQSEEPVEHPE